MQGIDRRAAIALITSSLAVAVGAPRALATAAYGRLDSRPHSALTVAPPPKGYSLLGINPDKPRDALLYTPAQFDPKTPIPLLVMLHGANENAAFILKPMSEFAEEHGVLMLAPTSHFTTWDLSHMPGGQDTPVIDQALGELFSAATIDPAHIALAGFSDGASYALSLGLSNGDLFSDVIAFSPGIFTPSNRTGRPRIFIAHGTKDSVLDFRDSKDFARAIKMDHYDTQFFPFEGDHTLSRAAIEAALARFLGKPATAPNG